MRHTRVTAATAAGDRNRTAKIRVLGAIAYGEWKAYENARADAAATDDAGERKALRQIAAEELRHHKGFVRALERMDAEPERAMRPYRRVLDAYHGARAGDPIEEAVWSYLGEGVADDLLHWLRGVVDDETAAFVDTVIADEVGHEARAARQLRDLLDATPNGRLRARRATATMLVHMARSGGQAGLPLVAFVQLGNAPALIARLVTGASRRLRAVGLGPPAMPLPRLRAA